ncbi:MAG: hypothetical protein LBP59_07370 [Planctomycetaceae bacterium]|nr:hypothetical protein [Planctomycetaceae bacterium]
MLSLAGQAGQIFGRLFYKNINFYRRANNLNCSYLSLHLPSPCYFADGRLLRFSIVEFQVRS